MDHFLIITGAIALKAVFKKINFKTLPQLLTRRLLQAVYIKKLQPSLNSGNEAIEL